MPNTEPLPDHVVANGAARTILSLNPESPNRFILTTYVGRGGESITRLERAYDADLAVLEFIDEATSLKDIPEAHSIALANLVGFGHL